MCTGMVLTTDGLKVRWNMRTSGSELLKLAGVICCYGLFSSLVLGMVGHLGT